MTKQEEYQLSFRKIKTSNNTVLHHCISVNDEAQSQFFSSILGGFDKTYTEDLIMDIEAAQKGQPFEEYHTTDALDDGFMIKITPPNVALGSQYIVPLDDWKELMQEWLDFIKPRSPFENLKNLWRQGRNKRS